jgi:hypothetical protein
MSYVGRALKVRGDRFLTRLQRAEHMWVTGPDVSRLATFSGPLRGQIRKRHHLRSFTSRLEGLTDPR